MPAPSFVSGATTVSFPRSITTPFQKEAEKVQVVGETDGGTVFVYTKASTVRFLRVGLPGLTEAIFTALYDFWNTTVNGKATAFTFNDEDGTAYTTARMWDDRLRWTKHKGPAPWYDVELLLRIGA